MTQSTFSVEETAQKPQAQENLLTFQEYLEYEGEPHLLYELVKGKLLPVAASTHLHTNIAKFLVYQLQRYFAEKNLDLVANSLATGVRTAENSARIPDVVVCSQTVWQEVQDRPGAGVLDFAEKPILVVEIVSSDRRNDYVIKRNEYEIAEIAEYWIVDPKKRRVRVFTSPSSEEGYDFTDFTEGSTVISEQFEQLNLAVEELLEPPLVEELIKEEQAKIITLEQRAEKLAQRLREMGINPEEI